MPRLPNLCLLTLSVLMLMSCASPPQESDEEMLARQQSKSAEVKVRGDVIIYRGPISEANNKKLFDVFDKAQNPPKTLTISSGGGLVEAGLEMGEWVLKNQLDVHIPRLCTSSCANYIFTAGKSVTLGETAIVFWHGSPTMDDLVAGSPDAKARREAVLKSLEKLKPGLTNPLGYWNKIRIRNRRFFRTVGIHPAITMPNTVADEASLAKIVEAASWTQYGAYMTLEDMKYFGINHVRVEGDRKWAPEKAPVVIKALIKVTLVDDVELRLAEITEHLNNVE